MESIKYLLNLLYLLKRVNCKVIGVFSSDYSKIAPLSKNGKRLSELSDVYIDNYGPPGDALVEITGRNKSICLSLRLQVLLF